MAASTLYFNMATHAADNTEKWSVNTTRMVILHCDLSHENVASCDQARISAYATCFRLALSLRVTRCGRHVPATCQLLKIEAGDIGPTLLYFSITKSHLYSFINRIFIPFTPL